MDIKKRSFWETLKKSDKPVILYGMGAGANKILDFCAGCGITVSGIFASDEFVREHYFRGFKVKTLAEIKSVYKNNFCILLCFAAGIAPVVEMIYGLNSEYELYVPNFPVFGENIYFDYEYYLKNREQIEQAYELFADTESKEVYENAVNFNITGKLEYLKHIETPKQSALDLLELGENITYIDLGAYDGDTVFELLNYNKHIKKIFAFEPDTKNFLKLEKNITQNNLSGVCELYNLGVWSGEDTLDFNAQANRNSSFNAVNKQQHKTKPVRVNSLDNVLGARVSGEIFIKYDVEGAEFEALTGTKNIIQKHAPKLLVSLYHKTGDIFKLPLYIKTLNPDYKLYLRKHRCIPCWDLNLYVMPPLFRRHS